MNVLQNPVLCLVFSLLNFYNVQCFEGRHIYVNKTYEFGKTYDFFLNNTVQYTFTYAMLEEIYDDFPARLSVSSENAVITNPVFITATQEKGVSSWQLPLIIDKWEMMSIARTLCPDKNILLENFTGRKGHEATFPIFHFTTSSKTNINVQLRVDYVLDFNLEFNKVKTTTVSPAKPVVYFYSFTSGIQELDGINTELANMNTETETIYQKKKKVLNQFARRSQNLVLDETKSTVLLHLTSNDDTCMLMSIQNASCPIFDSERELTYEGFYATISKQGGISVTRKKYPNGFYVVLVVKTNDKECSGKPYDEIMPHGNEFFDWKSKEYEQTDKFVVTDKSTREKVINITINGSVSYTDYVAGTLVLTFVAVAMYLIVIIGMLLYHRKRSPLTMNSVDLAHYESDVTRNARITPLGHSVVDIACNNYGIRGTDVDSVDGQLEPLKQIYLNELCTRDTVSITRSSNMYLWHLITVAVFYGLPVIQLVIAYQRSLNNTGNQDQCYYNFLCAHPLGFFSDFNHIYSNMGYILLGLLFILIAWRRKQEHVDVEFDSNYGIPQHYGLYYAMGGALMMEGVLSASYHICPNHTNFQFDTSFMYVIAVLCMIKIYQGRHPDVNARAHATFGVLAVTVFIGLIGVLFPNFYFWLVFTIIHITTCLLLSLQVYYMGHLKIDRFCCKQCVCGGVCRPAFRSRCIMVIIGNLCNWGLAGFGLYRHSKDFASHLLNLFLMNLGLYMFWYLIMKLIHKEHLKWYSWVVFVMALICWGGALTFFIDQSTSWSLTPAQSRSYNKHCALMNFYDNHDIWHILSAAAMFFSFMFFLTMDDDITHIPRHKIPVF